jgi:Activator of Hsp90 ATPase homolog 1-like protein
VTEPLRIAFEVACPQQHAFETWTARLDRWWPSSHSVSGRDDARVELQPRVGGAIRELLPDGTAHTWGEVTSWEPPAELGYRWHLGRDPGTATRVTIRFVPLDAQRTRVEVHHEGWEALGAEAETWRERNVAGWGGVVPRYRAEIEAEIERETA